MGLRELICTCILLVSSSQAHLLAQQRDSIPVYQIDSVCVKSSRATDGIKGNVANKIVMSMTALDIFPKVLGSSDPMKLVQYFPGVTTNMDNSSGIVVHGCDIGHTFTRLCGAPVFGHGHALGLFSTFIPEHFSDMDFSMSSDYGNIGGILSMETLGKPSEKFTGNVNVGPVASYFSLSTPLNGNSSFRLSARRSLVDIFYKNLIKVEDFSLGYNFHDINASYIHKLTSRDVIDANFYIGRDNCEKVVIIKDTEIQTDWGDIVGNVRWRHNSDNISISTQAYYSAYRVEGTFSTTDLPKNLSNSIRNIGFESTASFGGKWESGLSVDSYDISPQSTEGGEQALSASIHLDWKQSIENFAVEISACGHYFNNFSCKRDYFSFDPRTCFSYDLHHSGKINLNLAKATQDLFFIGPTSGGFPFEFWIAGGKYSDPQKALSADLSYDVPLFGGKLHLTADAFYKKLDNQLEYDSPLSEMLSSSFSVEKALLPADGVNYGFYAMLRKSSGALTGWLSYSFGRSLRRVDGETFIPSDHERIHEFNAVATYKYRKWSFSADVTAASGQPFTPCSGAYLLNNTILLEYGARNSERLSPYFRLDLSATFEFRDSGHFRDGINLSVRNATARNNAFMAALKIKDGEYSFRPAVLYIPVIPSINYFCNF